MGRIGLFHLFLCIEIHSIQVCMPIKPLFSRHKWIGVQFTDEPTGNLDTATGHDVLGLLKIVAKQFRQTIVLITHDNDIAQMADRIVRIEDGRTVRGSGFHA